MVAVREILAELMKNSEEMSDNLNLNSHPRRIIALRFMKFLNDFKEAIIQKRS
jgi:hypothetical protein